MLARTARVGWGLSPEVIRTIYVAVVEPTILYASAAWATAAERLGTVKTLNTVQRPFALKLIKAYRTVSLNAALVLGGILPLGLRVREVASLYEARRGLPHPALGDREVEGVVSVLDAPHPAQQTSLAFGMVDCAADSEDTSASYDVRIFTDGSKIDGKVGAALSFWEGGVETKTIKLALSSYCTVYQAELLALSRAVSEAAKLPTKKVGILSDSRSALQSVTLDSLHPLAFSARRILRECVVQNRPIGLFWIKAHAGMEGNERADDLAKRAAMMGSRRRPDYDRCPVSFVKRYIRMNTLGEWDETYRSGQVAAVTRLFLPSAIDAYSIVRKIHLGPHVTQLLTGHGGFGEYLCRFKCKDSPLCRCQTGEEETVPHLLLECPMFARERFDVEQALGTQLRREEIQNIMKEKGREKLLEFGIKIVKKVNSWNDSKNSLRK